jgi:hypothetical protein
MEFVVAQFTADVNVGDRLKIRSTVDRSRSNTDESLSTGRPEERTTAFCAKTPPRRGRGIVPL